jgi:hypothetical protein
MKEKIRNKMSFEIINGLIEKYFAGETSLDEEKILRGYFNGSTTDPRLASYASLFQFFEKEKQVQFDAAKMPKFENVKTLDASQTPFSFKTLRGGNFWKIAATVAFLIVGSVAIFKTFEKRQETTVVQTTPPIKKKGAKIIILDGEGDEKEALAKVNEALAMVSKKMKKGTDETTDGLMKLKSATTVLNNNN